jgi:hypothetical protein
MAKNVKVKSTKEGRVEILVALTTIRYNHKTYRPGEMIEEMDDKARAELLTLKAVKIDHKFVQGAASDTETDDEKDAE